MRRFAGAAIATLLLLGGGSAARSDVLRCSNDASVHAIAETAVSLFVGMAQAVNHDAAHPIDPAKVSVKLSDSYETAHSDFTKDCHAHLAISYEGATPEADIDYRVIQTDDGRIITKWVRDPQLAEGLVMQMILQRELAAQAAKQTAAAPESAAREGLQPKPPSPHPLPKYQGDWSQFLGR